LDTLQSIVDDKQKKTVQFTDGKMPVDMFTASAVMQVYDAVNDDNKSKIKDAVQTKSGFMKIAEFAMSKAKSAGSSVDKFREGVFDKDGMLGKFVSRDMSTNITTGEPFDQAKLFGLINVMTRDDKIESLKGLIKMAQRNSGKPGSGYKKGAPTIDMVPKLRAELEKLEKEAAMQGESVEEDSKFDRNFKKRIGYTVRGGAAADMMKKQAAQAQANNPDSDQGLGPAVLNIPKAREKAAKRGIRAPGNLRASPNTRDPKRLPESCSDCGKPRFVTLPEHIQAKYEALAEDKKKGVDGKVCWDGHKYAGKERKADGTYKDICKRMSAKEKKKKKK